MMLGNELITIKLYAAMGAGNNLGFWWSYCNPLSPVHPSESVRWLVALWPLSNQSWLGQVFEAAECKPERVSRGVNVNHERLWWNLGTVRASFTPFSYCHCKCTVNCLYSTSQPELTTVFVSERLCCCFLPHRCPKNKRKRKNIEWKTHVLGAICEALCRRGINSRSSELLVWWGKISFLLSSAMTNWDSLLCDLSLTHQLSSCLYTYSVVARCDLLSVTS